MAVSVNLVRATDVSNIDCSIELGFCCEILKSDCAKRCAIRGKHDATINVHLLVVLRGRTSSRRSVRYGRTLCSVLVAVYTGGRDSPFPNS